jgi:undecaprenyl-diphosphatase
MSFALQSQPWFAPLNYNLLIHLYRFWPFTHIRIAIAETFIFNPWLSTVPFALAYYLTWRETSSRELATVEVRRRQLLEVLIACFVAVLVTILLRPWVSWPAPSRAPGFSSLYPSYLWGYGNENCFPSHSTLVYLIVAVGLLPLHRRLAAALIAFVFVAISLPRIYLGGHYPIDVAVSIVLAIASYSFVCALSSLPSIQAGLNWVGARGLWSECLIFLWSLELGSGFRGTMATVTMLRHLPRFVGWVSR